MFSSNNKKKSAGILSNASAAVILLTAGLIIASISCGAEEELVDVTVYEAQIKPLNENLTGYQPDGNARLEILGDSITIIVNVSNLPPAMMHLQHYHGFVDGSEASCPTMEQDINQDSIVNLIETQQVAGVTLVPFHANPLSLQIATDTYPSADSMGYLSYQETISMDSLETRMRRKHGIMPLEFETRVVFIHGVNSATALPESVQSLEGVPAYITLPIACGEFELQVLDEDIASDGGYY
ncbi:MAG: hypothetical protein GWN14_02855 [candidate division Zixibacteria bacterium]|nr:hypothetical protein [candidate division Zixibacteria bacterium]NIW43743.1 hypothetical protein [Gammaproteobacteria bacterium]NIX54882.1 hypothetical protein [candidate division Zixibacteria bacterium]